MEFAEAEDLCNYIPEIMFCMETSAKENTNIEDAFTCLATELKVGVILYFLVREGNRLCQRILTLPYYSISVATTT